MSATPHTENPIQVPARGSTTSIDSKTFRRVFRQALTLLGVAILYLLAARIGLWFALIHTHVSPVWPPTGFAIAAVMLFGYRVAPAIFVGAFVANANAPVSSLAALAIALGNTLEAVTARSLLNAVKFHVSFERAYDVFKFVIVALVATMVSATIGPTALCLSGAAQWGAFGPLWLTWWLGDLAGALIVALLVIAWAKRLGVPLRGWRLVEAILLVVLLSIASLKTYGDQRPATLQYYPLTLLIIPFLLWASFRLGHRGVALAVALVSSFAAWGTVAGSGPLVSVWANESLIVLQLYISSTAVTFLFLTAVVEERRRAEQSRRLDQKRLSTNLAISRILAESPALEVATNQILSSIGDTLGWQMGAMWTLDQDRNTLRCLTFWRRQATMSSRFEIESRLREFECGVGLPGRIWKDRRATWIYDVTKDDNFPREPFAVEEGLHSAFGFPILAGEQFLGVMEFFSDEIREPDEALLEMFRSVGSQIGQFMERRRAEEALREREAESRQLASIVENTDEVIIGRDLDGLVTTWNAAAERLYGYKAEEMIGKPLSILVPPDRPNEEPDILNRLRRGERIDHYETFRLAKDGRLIPVSLTVSAIKDANGAVIGFSKIARDITYQKKVDAEREALLKRELEARAQAEEANRVKDEFLAVLSHELRTPLNAILGWANLLRSGKLDDENADRALEIVERNARAQSKLIEGVLDVSRIVSGKLQLDVRPLQLSTVVQAAVDSIRPAADAKNMTLHVISPAESEPLVLGDGSRLQQVVWNLLSNAVKFSPAGGDITVVLRAIHSHLEISVQDKGQGIPREFLPHVFDRFRQADSSTTRKHGGLGLGLAIVRHLVELHGGVVTAESDGPDHGAIFKVRLQAIAKTDGMPMAKTTGPLPQLESQAVLVGLKILVVDDHEDGRDVLAEMLSACNASVSVAGSAREAISRIAEWRPNVVVSDISMPDVDGYEFIRQVRSLAGVGNIPAIAVTAHALEEDRERALAAGFQEHLAKPVQLSELISSIAKLTGRAKI